MLTITTVNVNGLRAAARKGYLPWLAATMADVVCLQEVRAEPEQLTDEVRAPEGWHAAFAPAPATAKGRAGVALLTRAEPEAVRTGFGSAEFDTSGRYLEADLPGGLTVGSLYLPSGDVGSPRQDEKFRFMDEFLPYLRTLRERSEAAGRHAVVCGDWNIAHTEADLKNWKGNRKNSGFLPEERAWYGRILTDAGYTDVVRALNPGTEGPYSWWSMRGKAFDNDSGWRIDSVLATEAIGRTATAARVERAESYDTRWSDHAPVTVSFDIELEA